MESKTKLFINFYNISNNWFLYFFLTVHFSTIVALNLSSLSCSYIIFFKGEKRQARVQLLHSLIKSYKSYTVYN